jgi:hypothetical protein
VKFFIVRDVKSSLLRSIIKSAVLPYVPAHLYESRAWKKEKSSPRSLSLSSKYKKLMGREKASLLMIIVRVGLKRNDAARSLGKEIYSFLSMQMLLISALLNLCS